MLVVDHLLNASNTFEWIATWGLEMVALLTIKEWFVLRVLLFELSVECIGLNRRISNREWVGCYSHLRRVLVVKNAFLIGTNLLLFELHLCLTLVIRLDGVARCQLACLPLFAALDNLLSDLWRQVHFQTFIDRSLLFFILVIYHKLLDA